MNQEYCIMKEMPYCPCCPFFYLDTENCETYEDAQDAAWICTLTKERYEKYMEENKGEQ